MHKFTGERDHNCSKSLCFSFTDGYTLILRGGNKEITHVSWILTALRLSTAMPFYT